MENQLKLVAYGNLGLQVISNLPSCEPRTQLADKSCKVRAVDCQADLLAWADKDNITVLKVSTSEVVLQKPNTGVNQVKLSPLGTILVTWSPYKLEAGDNLQLYDICSGAAVQSFVQKKASRWCPVWAYDETICCRHCNMELLCYEGNQFNRYLKKMFMQKVADFSLSTHRVTGKHYIACYSNGAKGQPNFVRLYEYPRFEGTPIANKSFFKSDQVQFHWSARGDALVVVCSVDFDASGKSYYGEQALHYMDITGQTYVIKLNKDGPVHHVAWTPSINKESMYCIIYGFVPPTAALFNTKCEVVFKFGDSAMVNQIAFNPFGNLVALTGFGNLRGTVQVWDVANRRMMSEFKVPETTDLSWSPDGVNFMTSTTAPRMRIGNGFKIYDYKGDLLHEEMYKSDIELWSIKFTIDSCVAFKEIAAELPATPVISKTKEAAKYVPPALRNLPTKGNSKPSALSDVEKKIRNVKKKLEAIEGLKQQQAQGKRLEQNQLDKVAKECDLLQELTQLSL